MDDAGNITVILHFSFDQTTGKHASIIYLISKVIKNMFIFFSNSLIRDITRNLGSILLFFHWFSSSLEAHSLGSMSELPRFHLAQLNYEELYYTISLL